MSCGLFAIFLPTYRLTDFVKHAQPKGESLSSRPSAHFVPFPCQRRRSHPLVGGLTSVLRSIEPKCDGWPPFTRIGKEGGYPREIIRPDAMAVQRCARRQRLNW